MFCAFMVTKRSLLIVFDRCWLFVLPVSTMQPRIRGCAFGYPARGYHARPCPPNRDRTPNERARAGPRAPGRAHPRELESLREIRGRIEALRLAVLGRFRARLWS